jgi:hypothetical protein
MKSIHPSTFAVLAVFTLFTTAPRAPAQAFVNLDFESASIETNGQSGPAMWLDWNLAAPGWNHSSGDSTAIVYYLTEHLGMSQYFLLMDSVSPFYAPGTQLAGDYSLAFASGRLTDIDPASPWVNAFISQTGTIPADAQAVRLLATGPFRVFVDDVEIGMAPLGGSAYEGNIAPFAGMPAELRIMNTATTPHTPTVVDNIMFIPEPASAVVIAAGIALFWLRKRNA